MDEAALAMALAPVASDKRFTRNNPCPICGGHWGLPQGHGERCAGFYSRDGLYAHCTREEYANGIPPTNAAKPTYPHRLQGLCRCGRQHKPAPITPIHAATPARQPNHATNGELGPVVAEYPYYNAQGELIYKVTRHDPKSFRPWRPDGHGGWIMNLGGIHRVLYRLLDIMKYPDAPVYVVEGEKDVETLRKIGLIATCSQGGAEKWNLTTDASEVLRGRHVIIIPDNDDPGEKHGEQVLESLTGYAKTIKIVHVPIERGKDISDFFANGGTFPELVTLVEETPICGQPALRYQFLTDLDVQDLPPLRWLIDKVLPESCLSAIFGESWTGKSFVALDMAIRIALGLDWRGHATSQGPTVYIAAEGVRGLSLRLKAWKMAHGMDLRHSIPIHILPEAVPLLQPERVGDLLASLRMLPEAPKLVIIDTLGRSMAGGEENSNDDMNAICNAGSLIQREIGCNVMYVHHKPKGGTTMRGGSALFGGIDTAIEVEKDDASPLINITCRKQKDGAEPFQMIVMNLKVLILDEINHLTSCVVVPVKDSERIDDFTINTRKLLLILIEQFPNGVTSGDWEAKSSLPRQTFVNARQPLLEQDYVRLVGQSKGAKYIYTPKGKDWYQLVHSTYQNPGIGGEG